VNAPADKNALQPTAGAPADTSADAERDAVFDRLSHLFRHAGSDVTMQSLFRVLMDYRTGRQDRAS
jgi:hypothetical protein